jgi:hypothetical protein
VWRRRRERREGLELKAGELYGVRFTMEGWNLSRFDLQPPSPVLIKRGLENSKASPCSHSSPRQIVNSHYGEYCPPPFSADCSILD